MGFYIIIFLVFFLFLPITLSFYLFFNAKEQKLYFAIYLFKYFLVFSGYITKRDSKSIYLHVQNKAYVINFNNLTKNQNTRAFFVILSFYVYIDSAVNEYALSFLMLLNAFYSLLNAYLSNEIYFLNTAYYYKLNNKPNYKTKVNATFTITFNIFCILRTIIANYIKKGSRLWQNLQRKKLKI